MKSETSIASSHGSDIESASDSGSESDSEVGSPSNTPAQLQQDEWIDPSYKPNPKDLQ